MPPHFGLSLCNALEQISPPYPIWKGTSIALIWGIVACPAPRIYTDMARLCECVDQPSYTRSPCRIAMTAFSNANVTAARWIRKRQVKLNLGVLQTLFPLNNLVNFGQVVWITHALDSLRTRILFAQSHLEFLDKSPYLHRGKFTKLQWCVARLLEHLWVENGWSLDFPRTWLAFNEIVFGELHGTFTQVLFHSSALLLGKSYGHGYIKCKQNEAYFFQK